MRYCVLAAAFAAGLGLTAAGATEPTAGGVDADRPTPPVTTVSKAATDVKPADAPQAQTDTAAPVAEKPAAPPPPTLLVKVNLSTQRLDVIANGATLHSWPISSGRAGYETPRGTFRPQWAAKMWYSRKYDMAPMPHAVFINGGVAVHATSAVGMLGRPASHGCIRLAPGNAAAFYALVHKHGLKQTQVQVFGAPPAPRVAEARQRRSDQPVTRTAFGGPVAVNRAGAIHIRPGSPHYGAQSFELNGVRYVRVR